MAYYVPGGPSVQGQTLDMAGECVVGVSCSRGFSARFLLVRCVFVFEVMVSWTVEEVNCGSYNSVCVNSCWLF